MVMVRSAVDTMQGYMLDGRSIRVEFPESGDDMDMDKGLPPRRGGGFRGEYGTSEGYGSEMGGENASGVAKIYVGSLDFQIREKDLIEEFKKCGEVVDAKVLMDRNDRTRSRGYGFVTFADSAGAEKALAEMDGVALRGRRIKVGLATDPRRRDGRRTGNGRRPWWVWSREVGATWAPS